MKYQIIGNSEVLHEGEGDNPFEELKEFYRRSFIPYRNNEERDFHLSSLRRHLKHIHNHGGTISIKLIR